MTSKAGLLVADREGYFHLYEADFAPCFHSDTACDGLCVTAGKRVKGFKPTNAYGPAEVRAGRLGYEILDLPS